MTQVNFEDKKRAKAHILEVSKLPTKKMPLIASYSSLEQYPGLQEATGSIPAHVLCYDAQLHASDMAGFDAVIIDKDCDCISQFCQSGVVPIIAKSSPLASLFQDFDPMRSQGNAFGYVQGNVWSLFAALVRYSENFRYPYDNKTLVENVMKG